jgi:hypothetical protein
METYQCYAATKNGQYGGKAFQSMKTIYADLTNVSWSVAFYADNACSTFPVGFIAADGCAPGTCCPGDFTLDDVVYAGLIVDGVTDTVWNTQCDIGPSAGTVIGYIILVLVIIGIVGGGVYYFMRKRRASFSGV